MGCVPLFSFVFSTRVEFGSVLRTVRLTITQPLTQPLRVHRFLLPSLQVSKADCAAALRRAIAEGPPVWMSDRIALPLPAGDTHIVKFWWQETNEETDAKVDGALEGEEREKLWKQQRDCLAEMEAADGKEAAK
jgi:hypothetical protein